MLLRYPPSLAIFSTPPLFAPPRLASSPRHAPRHNESPRLCVAVELNLKGPPYPKRAHSRRCIHLVGRKGDQKLNSYLEVFATSLSLQCVCVCVFIQPYVRIYVRVCVHSCTFHPRLQFLVNSMVWTDTSVCRERIHVYVYLEEFVVDR